MTLTPQEQALAYARGASFDAFLKEMVWVKDVTGGRAVRWQWWPVHDQMVDDLANRVLVVLKARQVSWSWFMAAYCVHSCLYATYFNVLVISKGEEEAKEFLRKCHFIWEHLPDYLRFKMITDNTTTMVFEGRNSSIKALPSTEDAGRGETASLIVVDEAAFHPYGAANFASYSPAASEGGSQIVIVSTANGMGGFFHSMYQAGKDGVRGIVSRFYGWAVRPGRDEDWLEEQRSLMHAAGKADLFDQEFPDSDLVAFLVSGNPRFDREAVSVGLLGCKDRAPIAVGRLPRELQRIDGLQVWELPVPGEAYVMGTDSAQGLGDGDFDCTQVLHAKTLRHVACIHGRWEPDVFAEYSVYLNFAYNDALWGIEHAPQGHGHTVIQTARKMGVKRLFYQSRERTRRQEIAGEHGGEKVGWLTTVQTKGFMIDTLASRIATGALVSYDPEFWGECRSYVRDAKGGTNASTGNHDDRVMSMAIAVIMSTQPGATYGRPNPVLTLERSKTDGSRYAWNHSGGRR